VIGHEGVPLVGPIAESYSVFVDVGTFPNLREHHHHVPFPFILNSREVHPVAALLVAKETLLSMGMENLDGSADHRRQAPDTQGSHICEALLDDGGLRVIKGGHVKWLIQVKPVDSLRHQQVQRELDLSHGV
jgi:hypothetical protein